MASDTLKKSIEKGGVGAGVGLVCGHGSGGMGVQQFTSLPLDVLLFLS